MSASAGFERAAAWNRRSRAKSDGVEAWLLRTVDAGFASVLFAAPLIFGGRHDLGRFVFVLLVGLTASTWFVRQLLLDNPRSTRSTTMLIPILAACLVAVQLLPLPATLLDWVSPRNAKLLPMWTGSEQVATHLGSWQTISLAPADTRLALAMCLAYGLLFITAIQRLRSQDDVARMLRLVATAAGVMALFGLVQFFLSNGRFFWFYEIAARDTDAAPCGPFTNRNHFAHFLALGVGPLIAWLVGTESDIGEQDSRRQGRGNALFVVALAGVLALVFFAGLLTCSRGGAVALLAAGAVALAGCRYIGVVDNGRFVAAAVLAALVVGMLSLYGYDDVARRLEDYAAGSIEEVDSFASRMKIWSADLAAFGDGWLAGAGAGAHAETYPLYLRESLPARFTHAENGYLQIAMENGVVGVSLLIAALFAAATCTYRAVAGATDVRAALLGCGAAAGLVASIVHSLFDFVWYIPACMSTTLLLAACAVRLSHFATPQREHYVVTSRSTRIAAAVAVVIGAAWSALALVGPARAAAHWDAYRVISRTRAAEARIMLQTNKPERRAATAEHCRAFDASIIAELQQTVRHYPEHGDAHARLAKFFLQTFESRGRQSDNAMTVRAIRDAAIASRFASREALLAWLEQAFGDDAELLISAHRHVRHALALKPLSGDAYLLLAQLCFLEGRDGQSVDELVNQAVTVRPVDGDVLLDAGLRHVMQGRFEVAQRLWKRSFRQSGPHQARLIAYVCRQLPAATFLEAFRPDWSTLPDVWRRYRDQGDLMQLEPITEYGFAIAEHADDAGDEAAEFNWLALARMYADRELHDQALVCTTRAMELSPNLYAIRREHAFALAGVGQTAAAEKLFRWCLARHSSDAAVEQALAKARRPTALERSPTATRPQALTPR